MSTGIRYREWLERKARNEVARSGEISLPTHAELQSQGFDSLALEQLLIAEKEEIHG